jgi:two-component system, sensor histidine kinase and response regulator
MSTDPTSTVMIVDDTPANLGLLENILSRENYEVRALPNGQMALKAAFQKAPDLILLDIKMPGMDGYEVCAELKADARTRDIPIIFISALREAQDKVQAFAAGGVDYVPKPFHTEEVLARVRTHLKLKHMYEALQRQNRELEQAAKLRDDVDRIMRHDLKSPLNSMINIPALLIDGHDFSDEDKKLLKFMERSGYQMLNMINRSLDLYKIETGTYQAQLSPLDVLAILKNAANEAATAHQARGKSYCLLYRGEPVEGDLQVWVWGEKMLCYPMFANLLQNAFEASPAGDKIEIDLLEQDDDQLQIRITNSGKVAEEIRDRFFDKYVTAGKKKGTGLGTYSAKLCAETQKGTIRMEQLDGDKTRIVVGLCLHGRSQAAHSAAQIDTAPPLNEEQRQQLMNMLRKGDIMTIIDYLQNLTETSDCPGQAHELLELAKGFQLNVIRRKLKLSSLDKV